VDLWAGVRGGVGFETQGGPLALCHHRPADHLLCILGMVAWLPNSWSTKKLSKVQRLACLGITGAIRTTPTRAVEALVGLHPLDRVIQGEERSAAHHLFCLGCWSYLHLQRGHICILTRLQKSDPIFNMRVDVMKPVFNLEPKCRVTTRMLTREEWTRGPGTPPAVKGLICFTDGSRTAEGTGAGVFGQSANRRLSISLGKHATVFQADVCVMLACVHEIQTQDRQEKYVSICSVIQAALKALQAAKTTSPLVRQCQQALNDISI